MNQLISLLLILLTLHSQGQVPERIIVKKQQEKYYLSKTCYDILKWDEVSLKDKNVERIINNRIKTAVRRYRLSKDDAPYRCSGAMEYEPEFAIVYAKNGIVSYVLTAYTYFKGGAHGGRQFENMTFSTTSGKQIHFRELIDRNKIAAVDSLIIRKLKTRLGITDDTIPDPYKEQLPDLFFEVTDTGININFIGENYATSVIGFILTYQELEPYADRKGLLKPFYKGLM